MFILKLYDRKGKELKEGDIVKVSDGKHFLFFSEVKYLEDERVIAPFHTFSFHSFEKVNNVPANAVMGKEERYNLWYVSSDSAEIDDDGYSEGKQISAYLEDWRECERLLETKCYRIQKVK